MRRPAAGLAFAWVLAGVSAAAAEPGFGPWQAPPDRFDSALSAPNPSTGYLTGRTTQVLLLGAVGLYQEQLSPLKGFKCPSWPSCSGFALRSLRTRGALQGTLMVLDRLFIREHLGMGAFYPLVRVDGLVRYYDPPSNNDLATPLPPFRDYLSSPP